jgi:hypothetical protein
MTVIRNVAHHRNRVTGRSVVIAPARLHALGFSKRPVERGVGVGIDSRAGTRPQQPTAEASIRDAVVAALANPAEAIARAVLREPCRPARVGALSRIQVREADVLAEVVADLAVRRIAVGFTTCELRGE